MSSTLRPPGSARRAAGRTPAARDEGPFTPRRQPGSRRSGAGLSVDQRGRRHRIGLAFLLVLLLVVVGRLALLQGVDGAAYANEALQHRLRTDELPALRGAIVDRDGNQLAYTVEASRVIGNPKAVPDPAGTARALAPLLDVPAAQLTEKLSRDSQYVILAAKVLPETVQAIEKLGVAGISFEDDPLRLYPAGAVAGQVVGFTSRDGGGLAGIEQRYEGQLAGTPGKRRVEVGSGGNPIPSGIDESTPSVDGSTVRLTLDEDLQYVAEQRLKESCSDGATTRASAVVLDVATGQVEAMASCPGYDPARSGETDPDLLRNAAVSDVFEPGSVMKAVSLSAVLEKGIATPDTALSVPGHIQAGDRVVRDATDHATIDWTVTGIMAHSSNIGTIMLSRKLGDATLERYLRAFGIGQKTGVELPAESAGILQDSEEWTASRAANVPIGQGVSVTTLQMASVYQAIANGGVRIPPRVVASVTAPDGTVRQAAQPRGTRVISRSTAEQTAYMLEAVTSQHGTAPTAAIDGFRVAGKTGTAQRANPKCGCYEGGGFVTTFVGFAPADAPRYVVAVNLERPTSSAEGGEVAAPVFHDIMSYALTAGGVVPSGAPAPAFRLTP